MDVLEKAHELEREGRNISHLEVEKPNFPAPSCICEAT
jgi:(5-formylfuran-3-yl)methyl phosphate transaminase